MMEVSCLSQHLCSPREGHLNTVYKIFRYLQNKISNNAERITCDTDCVHTDEEVFEGIKRELEDWKDFYPDASEAHPKNNLEPMGEPVTFRVYVDANHSGNLANMRPHSRILIYINNTLIKFYIKRQKKIESSSFGSEFVALRISTEVVEALRYKISTFGVNLEDPEEV